MQDHNAIPLVSSQSFIEDINQAEDSVPRSTTLLVYEGVIKFIKLIIILMDVCIDY